MKRLTEKFHVLLDPKTADKIRSLKERFGLKPGEIFRELLDEGLERLITRHQKAKRRGTGHYRNN